MNILLGNGDGTFKSPVAYATGDPDASAVAVGDFNGDGKLDLAVANANCVLSNPLGAPTCSTGSVGVLLGNGDGTFQAAVRYSTVDNDAFTIATGDFNGDGKLDLVVGNTNCDDVAGRLSRLSCGDAWQAEMARSDRRRSILQAIPGRALNFAASNAVAVSDLNGDGKLDIVLPSRNILLGNGDGTFAAAQSYNPKAPTGVTEVVADFNGDGKPDLVVADPSLVTLLLNISAGFLQPTTTTLTSSPNPAELGRSVTFTATVASTSQSTPTGTVTFSDSGHALATISLASGTATFSTSALDAGVHAITATYSGDQTFLTSVSPELDQAVRGNTRTRLTSSLNPSHRGQSVTFTAAVMANSGATPTGKITFRDFATVLATIQITGGQASFTVSLLRRGPHLIRADYSGSPTDHRSFAIFAQIVK